MRPDTNRPRSSYHILPRRILSRAKFLACLTFLFLITASGWIASRQVAQPWSASDVGRGDAPNSRPQAPIGHDKPVGGIVFQNPADKAKKVADEAAAKKVADEAAAKKVADEAAAKKVAEKAAAKKKLADETAAKKLADETAAKKFADEAAAKKLADEAAMKKLADEAAAKKLADEAAAKIADEAAAKKIANDATAKKIADEAAAARLKPVVDKKQPGKPAPIKPCPNYEDYSRMPHNPGSGGPLNLPFMRPLKRCRKFSSPAIEEVIEKVGGDIKDLDLAQMFRNCFPNTLDTTISWFNDDKETPYSFVVTGDIDAMWLRDSTNQVLPYVAYANKDPTLKTFLRGVVLLQARYVSHHPYANAFQAPPESGIRPTGWHSDNVFPPMDSTEVYEAKYEVDSLSAFLKISYHYHAATGDVSFVFHPIWMAAAEKAVLTMRHQQEATFDSEGRQNIPRYNFTRHAQNPTDTQFLGGNGQPIRFTGMIKSHFRPSDDSSVFPFFVPGNAMASVELEHLAQLLDTAGANKELSQQARAFSVEIRNAIYKNAVVKHPEFGDIFAFEVDGYGSTLLMDDANIPSLLSLPYLGFLEKNDTIYQNTRRFVLSEANPYFFKGPYGSGVGGPHVGLGKAWPMSQTMRILTSQSDEEILDALKIIVENTDGTGLMHEAFNVFDNTDYTRPWFAWSNTLLGEAILEIAKERPYLIFEKKLAP